MEYTAKDSFERCVGLDDCLFLTNVHSLSALLYSVDTLISTIQLLLFQIYTASGSSIAKHTGVVDDRPHLALVVFDVLAELRVVCDHETSGISTVLAGVFANFDIVVTY